MHLQSAASILVKHHKYLLGVLLDVLLVEGVVVHLIVVPVLVLVVFWRLRDKNYDNPHTAAAAFHSPIAGAGAVAAAFRTPVAAAGFPTQIASYCAGGLPALGLGDSLCCPTVHRSSDFDHSLGFRSSFFRLELNRE